MHPVREKERRMLRKIDGKGKHINSKLMPHVKFIILDNPRKRRIQCQ
jgi:hypothetical protein